MQTTYSLNMAAKFAGMKADSGYDRVESRVVEEPNGIPFGYGVVAGTDPATQVKLPDLDSDVFRGIAVHTHTGTTKYANKDVAGIMTQGVIWAEVDEAVAVDDAAFVTTATGKLGKTSGAGHIPTGGVFKSATTGAGLAAVQINLP